MLRSRGMKQVRTSRNLRSFRSYPNMMGVSMEHLDRERLAREEKRLAVRQARGGWFEEDVWLRFSASLGRAPGPRAAGKTKDTEG